MIRLYDDPDAVSRAAADYFMRQARRAVEARGRFSVALSGGRTPRRTYELLAQPPRRDGISWPHIHVYWGDERCVAPDDERSNALMARRSLLDYVPVVWDHVHPIRCEGDPNTGALRYDELLRERFSDRGAGLDLVFLGLGRDGHTASLFPHSPVLAEKERLAAEVSTAGQQMRRVTMTPQMINAAGVVVFLVTGAEKASILSTVLADRSGPAKLPAQFIRPHSGRIIWMVDRAAAAHLPPDRKRSTEAGTHAPRKIKTQ